MTGRKRNRSRPKLSVTEKGKIQRARRQILKKYNLLQTHHIPALVFLYGATKMAKKESLPLGQLIVLGGAYMYKESGKDGNKDIFAPLKIHKIISGVICYAEVNTHFTVLRKKEMFKKLATGKYMITDKGLEHLKAIGKKFSKDFNLFEQREGELKIL